MGGDGDGVRTVVAGLRAEHDVGQLERFHGAVVVEMGSGRGDQGVEHREVGGSFPRFALPGEKVVASKRAFAEAEAPGVDVVTVDEAVAMARAGNLIQLHPLIAGLPPEVKQIGVTTKKQSSAILLVVNVFSPVDPKTGKPAKDEIEVSNFTTTQVKDDLARILGVGETAGEPVPHGQQVGPQALEFGNRRRGAV